MIIIVYMIILWAGAVGSVGAGPAQVARVLHDYAVIFGTKFRKQTHYSYVYIYIYIYIIEYILMATNRDAVP